VCVGWGCMRESFSAVTSSPYGRPPARVEWWTLRRRRGGAATHRIFQEGRAEWEKESHRMHELWEHDQKAWLAASKIVWRDLRSKRSEECVL
jgi:hypothetical protein